MIGLRYFFMSLIIMVIYFIDAQENNLLFACV